MTLLRLAIQKSGRLTDASRALISECGIELEPMGAKLRAPAFNFPLEVLFLRDDDIPGYVADGIVDAAIVGQNVLAERGFDATIVKDLGFGRCRLSIAVPRGFAYESAQSLDGLNIATSYPRILSAFLARNNVRASIHEITGSVEIAPSLGLGDAICDLVSSGSTLLGNGLREAECVLESQAVLIRNTALSAEKLDIVSRFAFRVDAVMRAKRTKYITLNTPNESIPKIVEILPGLKSPSVLPLATPGWSSLHTVVEEDNFWNLIEKLRDAGAQGILVLPIEKVIA
jgi:ATP phosphoribosyltransferase